MAEQRPHRATAMAILTSGAELRPKEGSFLGQVAFTPDDISEKQAKWLALLAERHLSDGGSK